MKQNETGNESVLKENAPQVSLNDTLLEEKDTEKVSGGVLFPKEPPRLPS